jgi:mRNA interferase RelE/StbE
MYDIELKSSVEKDLKKIAKSQIARILNKISEVLSKDPEKGKALKDNLEGLYSYRIGDYRVIYSIIEKDKTVLILRIGHRKDVYD